MKVFIFGSSGMLGVYLNEYLGDYDVVPITRKEIDLNEDFSLIIEKYNFNESDVIINAAGVIKQRDYSPEELIRVNSLFPHFLETLNCKIIHITTDCVFSGKEGNYNEDALHDCLDDYGKSKSLGEPKNICVIRTSIIGEELYNKKSLIEWVKSNKNSTIGGYINHFWNGVTCLELAKYIKRIIDENGYWKGVRHLHSPDTISKYQLVSYINEEYSLGNEVTHIMSNYCDRSLSSKYEFPISKKIREQISELKKFERFDFLRKLENFPTINYISIHENKNRIDELVKKFDRYNLKYIPHVFERCTSIEKITNHLHKMSDGQIIKILDDESISEYMVDNPPYYGAHTSHFKAIKEWYETTNEEYGLFCEDDLSFETVEYWNFTWSEFFDRVPKQWQTIQLSITSTDTMYYFEPEVHFRNRCWDDYSCTCYLIKRTHAERLLNSYYDSDGSLIFGYMGIDRELRPYYCRQSNVETCIYSTFEENTNYIFPLFLENQNFNSSVWNLETRDKEINPSYTDISNWWKNTGKNISVDQLFSYLPN